MGGPIIKAEQVEEVTDSEQFVAVPGYGIAYTSHVIDSIGAGYRQSEESHWLGPNEEHGTADTEWAYVLADDGLWVFLCHFDGGSVTPVGQHRWDAAEPDWNAVEALASAAA